MFVRRCMRWLTGLLSSPRHASQAKPSVKSATAEVSTPLVTNWLAASRRLRPARNASLTAVSGLRERSIPPRLRSGTIDREQVMAGRSRPLDVPPNPQIATRGDQTTQQQSAQTAPHSQPLAPRQESPSPEPAASLDDDAALHRQLAAFKQLVRLGVYNEGFRRDALPEQYARSLHPDDDFSMGDGSELSN